jgi:hypothetical protein
MTVTKVVRFSDYEVSTSDIELEEDVEFVTKRTFELLDQDEPFFEKQFKILQQTATEHCEAWKENLTEVAGPLFEAVEPIRENANRCVDCMMDAIHRAQLQHLLGRPKTLAMVGGPAPDIAKNQATRDAESLRSSIEMDEKPMRWITGGISPGEYTGVFKGELQPLLPGKLKTGIMKKQVSQEEPSRTMIQQILHEDQTSGAESLESEVHESKSSESLRSEAEAILQKHRSLLVDEEPHIPSGQRAESPIKLFSSQDLEEYLFQTDFPGETFPGRDPQNPIVLDDCELEEIADESGEVIVVDNEASHERMDAACEGEERDQPPSSPILQDYSSLSPTNRLSMEFGPIERFSDRSHVPLSKSLLYSMRSRNRDIENLLADLPTKYIFSGSGDDLSTDHLAAASSNDNSQHSSNVSQENSIDSTRDFDSTVAGSHNTVASSTTRTKSFKFISFRSVDDTMSTMSAPPRTQIFDRSLNFPVLAKRSNE